MLVWNEVKQLCEKLLRFREQPPPSDTIPKLFSKVYRLASNPCRNVPSLVKGRDNEPISGKDSESTQVLVLFYLLRELLKQHLEHNVKPYLAQPVSLLRSYLELWSSYSVALVCIAAGFKYQSNQWSQQGMPPGHTGMTTTSLGCQLWFEQILHPNRHEIERQIAAIILSDRSGVTVDTGVVKRLLHSFVQLGVDPRKGSSIYQEIFELKFLITTEQHYAGQGDSWMQEYGVEGYVSRALATLQDEAKRVDRYLDKSTGEPLRKALVHRLVVQRSEQLLVPAAEWMMQGNKTQLRELFTLLQHNEGCLDPLQKIVEDHIFNEGKKEIAKVASEAARDPSTLITAILKVYETYRQMVEETFGNHKSLVAALDTGARKFVGQSPGISGDKCAECLARYCHNGLRPSGGATRSGPEEMERFAKEVVCILRLLEAFDVFQSNYASLLSQRLIFGAYDKDSEELLILNIRQQRGRDYVHKWQIMFMDVTQHSKKFKEEFDAALAQGNSSLPFELNPSVLTSGSWPSTSLVSSVPLTVDLRGPLQLFEQFYKKQCGGRSVQWLPMFSHGAIRAVFTPSNPKPYELAVSHWQLLFLLLFNEDKTDGTPVDVPYSLFRGRCEGIDEQTLQKSLLPLVKQKIVIVVDPNVDQGQWVYRLNGAVSLPNRKLNLILAQGVGTGPAPPAEAPQKDETTGLPQVQQERKFAVQAAIVRILKSRRALKYQDLLSEVRTVLTGRFQPTVQDVKVNLETLLEKEFIERSPDDPNTFLYFAS